MDWIFTAQRALSTSYHKAKKSFSEGGVEGSTEFLSFSTNLCKWKVRQKPMNGWNQSLKFNLDTGEKCGSLFAEVQTVNYRACMTESGFLLEQLHRLCKHSVGRHWNLGVFFHSYATLYKVHGCIQVVKSLIELIWLQREIATDNQTLSIYSRCCLDCSVCWNMNSRRTKRKLPLHPLCASVFWPPLCNVSLDTSCRWNI